MYRLSPTSVEMNSSAKSYRVLSHLTKVCGIVLSFAILLAACSGKKTEVAEGVTNVDSMPSLYTRDVNTLISDSGITRYRIEADVWYMYEQNEDSAYWYFPEGIYVEQFDSTFNAETVIMGDTATFYKKSQIWRLDRNVHIENIEGRKFDTHQLFWDQKKRIIYSDSAIRITTDEEVIEGRGFLSNEQITKYTILHTTGIFTIEKDTVAPSDSVAGNEAVAEPLGK